MALIDTTEEQALDPEIFPFKAFEFDRENNVIELLSDWRLDLEGTLGGLYPYTKTVSTEDYTILDDDHYVFILVTTGASNRTVTLPTASANSGRVFYILKVDSGAGEVIVDGEGGETIEGFTTVRLVNQYDWIGIIGDGSNWLRFSGPIAPTTGEPSLGTGHPHRAIILNTDPAAGDVSPNVSSIDLSGEVPVGTTWITGVGWISADASKRLVQFFRADQNTVIDEAVTDKDAGTSARFTWEAEVDSERKMYWNVDNVEVKLLILVTSRYFR